MILNLYILHVHTHLLTINVRITLLVNFMNHNKYIILYDNMKE